MKNIFIVSMLTTSLVPLYTAEQTDSLAELASSASNATTTSSITREEVIDLLSQRMNDDYYRTSLIEAVTQVPTEHLQAFYKIMSYCIVPPSGDFSGAFGPARKAARQRLICAEIKSLTAGAYLLTPAVISTVDHFIQGVAGESKKDIVFAVLKAVQSATGEVTAERLTSFVNEVDCLSHGMDGKSKAKVISFVNFDKEQS